MIDELPPFAEHTTQALQQMAEKSRRRDRRISFSLSKLARILRLAPSRDNDERLETAIQRSKLLP